MLFWTFLDHFFDAFALAALCFWTPRAMLLELPNNGRTMLLELPQHGRGFAEPHSWACLWLDRDDAAAATSMPQRLCRLHSGRLDTAVAASIPQWPRQYHSGRVDATAAALILPQGLLDEII